MEKNVKFVFVATERCSEEEVFRFNEIITNLTEMIDFKNEYLRARIEENPPMLLRFLQAFLTIGLAEQRALDEALLTLNGILAEFIAMKYGQSGNA